MAYFRALERGGHRIPEYDAVAAARDFTNSAGQILRVANEYPQGGGSALYEQHPLDPEYKRQVPVALRKRPYLLITQVAILCFERIKDNLDSIDYWTLLGHIWTANTKDKNHYHRSYTDLYRELFASERDGRVSLMTDEEQAIFAELPPTLTVYRGCGESNKEGLSWSLSESTARSFSRDWNVPPWWIIRGTCASSEVLAFFNRDDEMEVIIPGQVTVESEVPYYD